MKTFFLPILQAFEFRKWAFSPTQRHARANWVTPKTKKAWSRCKWSITLRENWQVTQFLSPPLTTTTTEDRHARVARRQKDDWSFVHFVSALFFQRVIGDDYRPGILSRVHVKGTFWNVWSHVSCVVHVFRPFRLFFCYLNPKKWERSWMGNNCLRTHFNYCRVHD